MHLSKQFFFGNSNKNSKSLGLGLDLQAWKNSNSKSSNTFKKVALGMTLSVASGITLSFCA